LEAFEEQPIHFGPTYKFDAESKRFAAGDGSACAWTDRILYSRDAATKCLRYASVPSVRESTHL